MALNINGTTGISGVDGSASAPALQGTDSNTGINFAADTVNINTGGTTKATIDSVGSLLMGTNSSSGFDSFGSDSGGIILDNVNSANTLLLATHDTAKIFFGADASYGYLWCSSNHAIRIATNNTERIRIDSWGNILFNTTSESNITNGSAAAFQFLASGSGQSISTTSTGFKYQMRFYNPNGQVGYISTQNSATQFNTSSDYRLKENVTAISDGITRLKTLKPSRFNFKVDKDITVDGFLAHEVSSIVPEAITGTKDEVVTQAMIDAGDYKEGTLNDPIYQGIDQSKLVPLLTAALQEAVAKIEVLETEKTKLQTDLTALTARVTALEAG